MDDYDDDDDELEILGLKSRTAIRDQRQKKKEIVINQNRSNKFEASWYETRLIPTLATQGASLTPRNSIACKCKKLTPGEEEGSPAFDTNSAKYKEKQ